MRGPSRSVRVEAWFASSYRLRRRFVYVPDEWAKSPLERWLLRHGRHSDYVLYERRGAVDCAASAEPLESVEGPRVERETHARAGAASVGGSAVSPPR